MDQYVTSRSFSTAASMLALACVLEKRWLAAALWIAFTAAVHPLMAVFLLALVAALLLPKSVHRWEPCFHRYRGRTA